MVLCLGLLVPNELVLHCRLWVGPLLLPASTLHLLSMSPYMQIVIDMGLGLSSEICFHGVVSTGGHDVFHNASQVFECLYLQV